MDLFNLVAKLTLDSSEYEGKISALQKGMGGVAKVGAAALGAATAAAGAFGAASVRAGMDFDSAMAQVAATSGKSIDEIGELREFAQEMGSTTAFSATQAAEALNYMALAGYDAETSMKMLPNVLNLAAAGGMDLAQASDMVTDAQTALGLSLDETETMVDQMAKASSTTNTSVQQLGDAFLTVGGNAKSVAGGTAELSSVLGAMADNGIKGSEAGTHLRNILLAMNPTTDAAAEAWSKLGVEAYDAEGNLRPLEDVFMELNGAMDGMTDQEKTDLISKMFNKTDLAAVNALLSTTSDRWEEIDEAVGNAQGSAQKMADTQLDNLAGDVTLFKSALEGAQIAVSDQLTPSLRDFVQLGTQGLSDVTQAFNEGGLEGAMDAFGEWLSNALTKVTEMLPKLVDAGARLLTSLIQGITKNIPQIMQAAVKIVLSLVNAIVENLPTIIEAGIQAIIEFQKGLAQAMPDLIPTIVDAVLTIVDTLIDNLDLLIEAGVTLTIAIVEGLIKAIPKIIEKIPQIIESIVGALTRLIPEMAAAGVKLFVAIVKNLPQIIASIVKAVPKIITGIVNGFKSGFNKMVEVGKDLLKGLGNGLIEGAKGVIEKAKNVAGNVLSAVKGFFGVSSPSKVFHQIGGFLMEGMADGITDNMGLVEDAMNDLDAMMYTEAPTSDLATETATTTTNYGDGGEYFTVPRNPETKQINVVLELDRMQFARAVYTMNDEETQRVGMRLAGGIA